MDSKEIALNLTIKAMESGLIVADEVTSHSANDRNDNNIKAVCGFYKEIYKMVNNPDLTEQ